MSEIKLWLAAENERLEAELATANAKIEAVRVVHSLDKVVIRRNDGRRYCGTDWQAHPCSTIRALADPAPQESHAGSLAGNPLREENGTTGGRPIVDPEC